MKKNAIDITKQDLKACITDVGFVAGPHHFVDPWARDSLFATFGANVVGLTRETQKTIEAFLSYQREDGLVPYLIQRTRVTAGKYLFGHNEYYPTPVATFRSHQSGGLVPDGGLMTVVAVGEYYRASKDRAFIKKHYAKLCLALDWYEKRFSGTLISEWFLCEWADAVLKIGNTLYTNVLYWKALGDMALIAKSLKKTKKAAVYLRLQKVIGKLINERLWNGVYFADWRDWKRQDYFAAHPNMLAIFFGLATKKQASSILNHAKSHSVDGWAVKTNVPSYPWWRVPAHHHAVGVGDYHNGLIWLQPVIWYSIALHVTGNISEAKRVLQGVTQKIEEHQGAHEVYERTGIPVKRLLYRSEHPFAWSAGLFLFASSIILSKK